ncbi:MULTISPECIES: DnaD domain-containing protein [Mammaliicoccus]|uniref:DnaD domain-containing protein n=2 Tax=Mammaliicoccus vitulinus TaxID=71237 RepID=A0ABX7HDT2_9STAP|nr:MULTISPECIES: DnaD domain-containing protein [Mammaliicoccus]MBO3077111.1 DnaD domain-containing protein [Mammaliicoccus vitulinus]PNZ40873.1 DNA replication protein DnaD [Mammaliicoccus vitulinus]PTI37508.1 DnaD domain protein [Mammaliicoccus vitulinus]PTI72546.1 DnaD domain protein [Mammaliicoccus vitulinus]PTI88641.1 DnaD domain protein [Mammaliicoccus vitulinus]
MYTREMLREKPVVIQRALFNHYVELGLNEKQFVILIKLLDQENERNIQPPLEDVQQGTSLSIQEVSHIINQLSQLKCIDIKIEKDEQHKYNEFISFDPLFEQLALVLNETKQENKAEDQNNQFKKLFQEFESTFGRPLTPLEVQTLNHWIDTDHHSNELIRSALNEAHSLDKLSIKYIDRILLNWKKKNITTVQSSKEESEKFNQNKKLKQNVNSIPIFDWVNGENPYDK